MDTVNSVENWVALVPNHAPEPEFYKYADEKSREKIQIGQCWEIYDVENVLSRYYGEIIKIDLLPKIVQHVGWFYVCPLPKSSILGND